MKIEVIESKSTKDEKKSYLEKCLIKSKNRLKKYTKNGDQILIQIEENRIKDLEEQINELL